MSRPEELQIALEREVLVLGALSEHEWKTIEQLNIELDYPKKLTATLQRLLRKGRISQRKWRDGKSNGWDRAKEYSYRKMSGKAERCPECGRPYDVATVTGRLDSEFGDERLIAALSMDLLD
jgi:hypothetical protein